MVEENRIDVAASVLTSKLHQGDGGREARDLLAFDANTMGRADYTAMMQQVQTTEALGVNDMMRGGKHEESANRLREDANIFGNGQQFMELAGEVRAMNKATHSPSHLEFDPIYQNGDRYGRPSALEVAVKTTFQSAQTGELYDRKGVVARVDNQTPTDANYLPPTNRDIPMIEPPPQVSFDGRFGNGGVGVGIGIDSRGNFDLELAIGQERVQRHDPRWCPDNNWHPYGAPSGFNLQIEIDRTRSQHQQNGDSNWSPNRETPKQVINQINNTTIINNVNNSRDSHNITNSNNTRTTTETQDNSRTRTQTDSNNHTRPQPQETPARPATQYKIPEAPAQAQPATQDRPAPQDRTPPQRRETPTDTGAADRQREAAERRQKAIDDANARRDQHDKPNKK